MPASPLGATGASNGMPTSMGSKGALPPGLKQMPNGTFMRAPGASAGSALSTADAAAATVTQAAAQATTGGQPGVLTPSPSSAPLAAAPAATGDQKVFLPLNPQTTEVQVVDMGAAKEAAAQALAAKSLAATEAATAAEVAPVAQGAKQEEFIPPAEEVDVKMASNIQDVPMAQGLINQIQRETR